VIANPIILWLLLAGAGVLLSALFSGMETGVYGVNMVRLHVRAGRGDDAKARRRTAALLAELSKQDRLLATLLIGTNVSNYLAAIGFAATMELMGWQEWKIVLVNGVALTPVLFVFGETLPKDWFRASADRVMPRVTPIIVVMRWIFTAALVLPIVRLFGAGAVRLLSGTDPSAVVSARARLVALLKEGRRHGVLSHSQTAILDRAVMIHRKTVADEMTPWRHVVRLDADWTPEHVQRVIRGKSYSSYPVVDRRGSVIGVVRAIDVWLERDIAITTLMKPVVWLEASASIVVAAPTLREGGCRVAVVRRRGQAVGVATMRDLFEPLLGEIQAT